jgi:hypothetical protein
VTSTHPELQNWAGGILKLIELIEMNSRFVKIHKKAQEQKWLKNWRILKNLKDKKSNDWPGALDHLTIDLVDNKYTKNMWKFVL